MAGTSGVWPLFVAVADAIMGDATVRALLNPDGVYSGAAPEKAALSYIVLGTMSETEFAIFANGASTLALTLHLWCPGPDGASCAQLYGELHRVLNRSTLELEGFGPAAAFLMFVDMANDPQDKTMHGVARLELTAVRT